MPCSAFIDNFNFNFNPFVPRLERSSGSAFRAVRILEEALEAVDSSSPPPPPRASPFSTPSATFEATAILLRSDLASALLESGRTAEAEETLRALDGRLSALLGPTHDDTLRCKVRLALVLTEEGELAEAHKLLDLAVPGLLARLGETHPDARLANLVLTYTNAHGLLAAGEVDPALELLESVLRSVAELPPSSKEGVERTVRSQVERLRNAKAAA